MKLKKHINTRLLTLTILTLTFLACKKEKKKLPVLEITENLTDKFTHYLIQRIQDGFSFHQQVDLLEWLT